MHPERHGIVAHIPGCRRFLTGHARKFVGKSGFCERSSLTIGILKRNGITGIIVNGKIYIRKHATVFGHGLQHMLTRVDRVMASGIRNIEWDAVELPSQFMENWCYHRETVHAISAHMETGESLPDELFEKLEAARTYRAGSNMLRQLYFACMDLALHDVATDAEAESPFAVQRRIAARTAVMAPLPEDRFLCSFGHIFAGGYAAGYYSYKWAEVLSADAFAAFEENGIDDPRAIAETGRRFRDTVLALGGSRHPMEVFKAFRGREPEVDALLRHSGLVAA